MNTLRLACISVLKLSMWMHKIDLIFLLEVCVCWGLRRKWQSLNILSILSTKTKNVGFAYSSAVMLPVLFPAASEAKMFFLQW